MGGVRSSLDAGAYAGVLGPDPGVQDCTVHLSTHLKCVYVGFIKSYWMSDHYRQEDLKVVLFEQILCIKVKILFHGIGSGET